MFPVCSRCKCSTTSTTSWPTTMPSSPAYNIRLAVLFMTATAVWWSTTSPPMISWLSPAKCNLSTPSISAARWALPVRSLTNAGTTCATVGSIPDILRSRPNDFSPDLRSRSMDTCRKNSIVIPDSSFRTSRYGAITTMWRPMSWETYAKSPNRNCATTAITSKVTTRAIWG